MTELEARFPDEMIEKVYRAAGRETGYWAYRFLGSVRRHGGVQAAKRLLQNKGVSAGFLVLIDKNRLDLAVETFVLKPEFQSLFSDEERAIASQRLAEALKGGGRST